MQASDPFANVLEENDVHIIHGPVDYSMTNTTPFETTRQLSARA
jgi:hypothetical protein